MKRQASEGSNLGRKAQASALATNVLLVQAAKAITESVGRTMASSGEQSPLAAADSKSLREYYELWVETKHCEQGFERLADLVKSQLLSQFPAILVTSEPRSVPILCHHRSDERIELTSTCFVGRSTICHLKIEDPARVVSRVQFMALPIAELELILVIPFGGLSTTVTLGRSSKQPIASSSSEEPTVMVFGYTERAMLQLGKVDFRVGINACFCKEVDSPLCGHCRLCNACRLSWSENWPPTLRD